MATQMDENFGIETRGSEVTQRRGHAMNIARKFLSLGMVLILTSIVIWIILMVESYSATGSIAIHQALGLFCVVILGILEIQGKR
jgi:hypothetical protein